MSAPLSIATSSSPYPTRLFGTIEVAPAAIIEFPDGLPGFPFAHRFALLRAAGERLRWLQSLDRGSLAFLLVEWDALALPLPEFSGDAFAIVTLPRADEPATANLAAPVLIDPAGRSGCQLIRTDPTLSTAVPFDLEAVLQAA